MPRSSGGGSHRSGGSHSHHSGGSSHRSRSGSHSSGSAQIRRSSYFEGSKRYFYYKDKKPVFFYANYNPAEGTSPLFFLMLLVGYGMFITIGIMMCSPEIHFPVKLRTNYDTQIVISDGADVIEDEAKLEASLQAFYKKTGITPAVMTVHNEDWMGYYGGMEAYAYKLYVNSFLDEKHWLIVYSQPKKPKREFNDWFWEGMQGDDTVGILTGSVCDDFNVKLQRYLMSGNYYTVGEAIGTAFDEMTPVIMKKIIRFRDINPGGIFFIVFAVAHMTLVFGGLLGDPHERKAVACPENAKEAVCVYCGGIYVAGTCIKCPHCNAQLRVHNPYNQETDDSGTSAGGINLNGEEIKM